MAGEHFSNRPGQWWQHMSGCQPSRSKMQNMQPQQQQRFKTQRRCNQHRAAGERRRLTPMTCASTTPAAAKDGSICELG